MPWTTVKWQRYQAFDAYEAQLEEVADAGWMEHDGTIRAIRVPDGQGRCQRAQATTQGPSRRRAPASILHP